MKHAYLIIAHNEFEVLGKLIQALDDPRNDIYIHFDKKVKSLPKYHPHFSELFVLKKRIDVRWGHVSQIEAEFALFEAAYQQDKYAYYHLISGVHLPLQTQDYLHDFFDKTKGKAIMMKMPTSKGDFDLKINKYNFFVRNFMNIYPYKKEFSQALWTIGIRVQKIFHINRGIIDPSFNKASQWVSLTEACMKFLLSNEKRILKKYRFTLCGDEFFIPTELGNSICKDQILYYDKLLKCDFIRENPKIYRSEDFGELILSACLFARKFSSKDISIVDKILSHIKLAK